MSKSNVKNDYSKKQEFYLVSMYKTTKKMIAQEKKSTVTKIDGAGYIYFYENHYYILGFCYKNKTFAQEKLEEVKEEFSEASVLYIKCDALNKNIKNKITQDFILGESLKLLGEAKDFILGLDENNNSLICASIYKELDLLYKDLFYQKSKFEKEKNNPEAKAVFINFLEEFLSVIEVTQDNLYLLKSVEQNVNFLKVEVCFLWQSFTKALNML